jgi:CUG-BP- and ETR3-like factor
MDGNGAAPEAGASVPAGNPVKLFVGQVPRALTEKEIETMFSSFGPIKEVSILRGPGGVSKGCAFVTLLSPEMATAACSALNHSTTFEGCRSPMVVKPADSNDGVAKLFVGQIPRNFSEDDMRALLSPYGQVNDVSILRHPDGVTKGCGFATMENKAAAQSAISALDHSKTFEGCRSALVVRFADTDKDKAQKKGLIGGGGVGGFPMGSPMMYGMSPVQAQALMFQQQHLLGLGGMHGQGHQGAMAHQNPMGFGLDMSQAQAGVQQFYAGGFAGQQYGQHNAGPQVQANQRQGPEGANLFIYHLPKEFDDNALATTFLPFGNIVSARVFVDPKTGESKCFGFVSYDNAQSGTSAIQAMDGLQIGNKRIKVSHKRNKGPAGMPGMPGIMGGMGGMPQKFAPY